MPLTHLPQTWASRPEGDFVGNSVADTDQRDFHQAGWKQPLQAPQAITTVMIRSISTSLSRRGLLTTLDRLGFQGLYDFVHLPMAFGTSRNKGFAFVNFDDETIACRFCKLFPAAGDQLQDPAPTGQKVWRVSPAEVQGYEANAQAAGSRKMTRVRRNRYRPLLLPKEGGEEDWTASEVQAAPMLRMRIHDA